MLNYPKDFFFLYSFDFYRFVSQLRRTIVYNDNHEHALLTLVDFLFQFSEVPDPMWGSDYVQLSRPPPPAEQKCSPVSWEELTSMDLPSFEPAFRVLCRVLLNVIHECLKLRLEQRPAGEPSLLSIKQVGVGGSFETSSSCYRSYRSVTFPEDFFLSAANSEK